MSLALRPLKGKAQRIPNRGPQQAALKVFLHNGFTRSSNSGSFVGGTKAGRIERRRADT
jgi:hypothetical protein